MGFAVRAADVFDHSDVRAATVARVWQGFSRTVYLAKGSASELPFTVRRSELVEVGLEDVAAYVEGETVILPYLDTLEPVIAIRFTPPETVHVAWVYVLGERRGRPPGRLLDSLLIFKPVGEYAAALVHYRCEEDVVKRRTPWKVTVAEALLSSEESAFRAAAALWSQLPAPLKASIEVRDLAEELVKLGTSGYIEIPRGA